MKFPRNTRIFRGQLDVAPVACFFFTTAILLFLHSQIVFVPGVRLDLHPSADTNRPSLYIDGEGLFHFGDASNGVSRMSQQGFVKRIRAEAAKAKGPAALRIQTEPTTPPEAIMAVRALAAELSIGLESPGTRIELPVSPDQPGSKSPSLVVAVNLSGQLFYENQLVDEKDLQPKLARAAAQAREPLTLILRLDRATAVETFVRLSEMARKAGFRDVILGTRPPLKPVDPEAP